jgi:hypothetical protein
MTEVIMQGVREYTEEMEVTLKIWDANGRLIIHALNEAGYNCTEVDLLDLLDWVRANENIITEWRNK